MFDFFQETLSTIFFTNKIILDDVLPPQKCSMVTLEGAAHFFLGAMRFEVGPQIGGIVTFEQPT